MTPLCQHRVSRLRPTCRNRADQSRSVRINSEEWFYDVSQSDMVAWLQQRLPVGQPFHVPRAESTGWRLPK